MSKKILIMHGPNLNLLGEREPTIYGNTNFQTLNEHLIEYAKSLGMEADVFQSNHEGALVDKLHEARKIYNGIVLNAGAYTHYSYAISDAIKAIRIPVIEVHISNIFARDAFRSNSVIAPVCKGSISGFGLQSYDLAVKALADMNTSSKYCLYRKAKATSNWSSISEIGNEKYDLTLAKYLDWENRYLQAVDSLIDSEIADTVAISEFESDIDDNRDISIIPEVEELMKKDKESSLYQALKDGKIQFSREELPELLRFLLRDELYFVITVGKVQIWSVFDYNLMFESERNLLSVPLPEGMCIGREA